MCRSLHFISTNPVRCCPSLNYYILIYKISDKEYRRWKEKKSRLPRNHREISQQPITAAAEYKRSLAYNRCWVYSSRERARAITYGRGVRDALLISLQLNREREREDDLRVHITTPRCFLYSLLFFSLSRYIYTGAERSLAIWPSAGAIYFTSRLFVLRSRRGRLFFSFWIFECNNGCFIG